MKGFVLTASRVATPTETPPRRLRRRGGPLRARGRPGLPPDDLLPIVELGDTLVAPGFVDVHVHGGGGAQVNCATREEVESSVRKMAQFHATHGTTALVATTVSDSPEALRTAVEGVAAVALAPGRGCPRVQPRGSVDSPVPGWGAVPGALRPPSIAEFHDLVARSQGTLRLVTVAPELDGALKLITAARAAGVVVAIGHTDADYETATAAFEAGARHATHLFNAMAPIHHRRPGPVTATLADDRVYLEIIADGIHIHPAPDLARSKGDT